MAHALLLQLSATWATVSLAAAPTSAPTASQVSSSYLAHAYNAQYRSVHYVLQQISVPIALLDFSQ